jgi:hypothetical protein
MFSRVTPHFDAIYATPPWVWRGLEFSFTDTPGQLNQWALYDPSRCAHFIILSTFNFRVLTDPYAPALPREFECVFCNQIFARAPSKYLLLVDLGHIPAIPEAFPLWLASTPSRRNPQPFPSLNPAPNPYTFTEPGFHYEPEAWDETDPTLVAFYGTFQAVGMPYIHSTSLLMSQEDLWARIIERNQDQDLGILVPEDNLRFFPPPHSTYPTCQHMYLLSSYNLVTRSFSPPGKKSFHCLYCNTPCLNRPPSYEFLIDIGCLPPIPRSLFVFWRFWSDATRPFKFTSPPRIPRSLP